MSRNEKIWYSFKGKAYEGHFPAFFDPSQYTWAINLTAAFPQLEEEIRGVLQQDGCSWQPYFNQELVSKKAAWRILTLKFWDVDNAAAIGKFPVLFSQVQKIPGIVSCMISIMDAKTMIKPHEGDTNAIIRCHLGIDIPAALPVCGLEVRNEQREWKKGELLMFCDAYEHTAWNQSDKQRVVVIIDVIHDQFLPRKKQICSTVLSMLWLQKKRLKPFYRVWPGLLLGILLRLRRTYLRFFGLKWDNS